MTDTKGIIPKHKASPTEAKIMRLAFEYARWYAFQEPVGTAKAKEELRVAVEDLVSWYDAVTDQGVITHVGWDENDARGSLNRIIDWHVRVALDPKVSSDAEALIQKGREESKDFTWVCNECGSKEYTSSVLEQDLEDLSCSGCGSDEFHKEFTGVQWLKF